MPFPNFDFCMICDGVRPELAGKLMILGFYGLAPNVEIGVKNPAAPVNVGAFAGFPAVPDAGTVVYQSIISVVRPDDTEFFRTQPEVLTVSAAMRGFLVFGFVVPPPIIYGQYSIRISVNGQNKLTTSFRIQQAREGPAGLNVIPPVGTHGAN